MPRDFTQAALAQAKDRMSSGIADVAKRLGGTARPTAEAERQLLERMGAEDMAKLFQAAEHKGDGKNKCPMCKLMKRQVELETRRLKRIRGEPDIEALAGGT